MMAEKKDVGRKSLIIDGAKIKRFEGGQMRSAVDHWFDHHNWTKGKEKSQRSRPRPNDTEIEGNLFSRFGWRLTAHLIIFLCTVTH
jgi:hypothetical protein